EEEGVLDANETEYIHNIFNFGNQTVEEIMTPRANLLMVSDDTALVDILELIRRERFTRIPVYQGSDRNEVIGVLHARDLLGRDLGEMSGPSDWIKLLRKPFFTPPTIPAADLFRLFRERRMSMAMVLDEYGEILGVATMDDIMESIFGEIDRPVADTDQQEMVMISEGKWRVSGNMEVSSFNGRNQTRFDDTLVQTMGGLVLHSLGEMPVVGNQMVMDGWSFTVTAMKERRITELLVEAPADRAVDTQPSGDNREDQDHSDQENSNGS
ncbi:MAG: HlyC/CorC family transporter, partial [Magnetococcales bacterium]|nr:HlyC/CorC family transporter [Magnetococcales bacterium]